MRLEDAWWVCCRGEELSKVKPLSFSLLGIQYVLFRDENGIAVCVQDYCIHRGAPLSKGTVRNGCLKCSYHGWAYDGSGRVSDIPYEPKDNKTGMRRVKTYRVCEQDNFIFVCLSDTPMSPLPMRSPHFESPAYRTQRLVNRFENSVPNCAENFINVPHTVFIHPVIFRVPKKNKIQITVTQSNAEVQINYYNESDNFGLFSNFLNPSKSQVIHIDRFIAPNITTVEYHFDENRKFIITSFLRMISHSETMVYTDLTYSFGLFTRFSGPIVRLLGQKVIDQDLEILKVQQKNFDSFSKVTFCYSGSDCVMKEIEKIWECFEKDQNPFELETTRYTMDILI